MLKAKLSNGDLVLGLSDENIKRLKAGRPIRFDARPMGYDGCIAIVWGETELKIMHELTEAFPGSEPQVNPS